MQSIIKYIFNMKRLPFLLLLVVMAFSFFAFRSNLSTNQTPPGKYELILKMVGQMLSQGHFSPQEINDNFSKKVFDKYVSELDPEKNIFLKNDYDSLYRKYGSSIDDEINGSKAESFLAVSHVFDKRVKEEEVWTKEILSKPFDYTIKESVNFDGTKSDYAVGQLRRKDLWRKKLKYIALERYVELLDEKAANKNKKDYGAKSDVQLEKDARIKTDTLITRVFDRYKAKYTDEDKFNMFVNAITSTMDPHTEFFPPLDKRYFDEEMSGTFYGIGAGLQYAEGNIKIISINAGSPASKSGMLQQGDIITKVAQGDQPAVDLMGYSLPDAIKLIRGKEGTIVTLTIKKTAGTIKTVKLKREKIVNEEVYAHSAIIKNSAGYKKIGIIHLPEFYASMGKSEERSCYQDVAKEVEKLKGENVDGIILDLRYNGGGSLYDVVQMVGLFVGEGPVVQVKDRNNRPTILRDKEKSAVYTGPFAVMVNEFSASASEIFAAAIQDYGRGVIIGSTSTYGKGTVQRNIGLDDKKGFTYEESDLGTVKLTLQKFYRISGGSTQLKGVASDIILPDPLDNLKLREKDDKDALPYDEIPKADYIPYKANFDIARIQTLSNQRLQQDSTFRIIKANSEWISKENDKIYPLDIVEYRKEKLELKNKSSQIEAVVKLKNKLKVELLPAEVNKYADDKNKQERLKQWLKLLSEDIYLNQTVKVIDDMIGMNSLANNEKK
jgi:carboxyl-terminal processing protease